MFKLYRESICIRNTSHSNTDLSCLCLVARARCSSSMIQLGGSCGCSAPRWGDPVGVEILPLNREPWGSLGSVKFLGKVAGDFFTGTGGAPEVRNHQCETSGWGRGALRHQSYPGELTLQAAQSGEQFDWQVGWGRSAGSSLRRGRRRLLLLPLGSLCLPHRLLLAGVAQWGAFIFSIVTVTGVSYCLCVFSHIVHWNEASAMVTAKVWLV